jgi:hypothetical protein
MYNILMIFIIGFFLALLFLNIYFRVKVMKHYKYLVQNRIEFNAKHILDKDKMETEVLVKYPEHASEIDAFATNIRNSVKIAAAILVLISLLGLIINKF